MASKQIKFIYLLRSQFIIILIKDYIVYLLKAVNADKIHSPFVFDIYYNHLLKSKEYYAFNKINEIRLSLAMNATSISKSPFGAGKHIKNKKLKIAKLSEKSTIKHKYGKVLFDLVNYFEAYSILEIGTCFGVSTLYLALPSSKAVVYALEGYQPYLDIAKENAAKAGAKNINFILGDFEQTLPQLLNQINHLDFVFFDGNHQEEATLKYFELCLSKKHDNSIFVFDDIYWSAGMKSAWEQIKKHPEVSITLDLFQLGIVFFRKGIVKQDFVLKY